MVNQWNQFPIENLFTEFHFSVINGNKPQLWVREYTLTANKLCLITMRYSINKLEMLGLAPLLTCISHHHRARAQVAHSRYHRYGFVIHYIYSIQNSTFCYPRKCSRAHTFCHESHFLIEIQLFHLPQAPQLVLIESVGVSTWKMME